MRYDCLKERVADTRMRGLKESDVTETSDMSNLAIAERTNASLKVTKLNTIGDAAMTAPLPIARRPLDPLDIARLQGLAIANAEDASLWRWFSLMMQDSRIRWCVAHGNWLVSVSHRHVATEASFDEAIRAAKTRFDGPDKRR